MKKLLLMLFLVPSMAFAQPPEVPPDLPPAEAEDPREVVPQPPTPPSENQKSLNHYRQLSKDFVNEDHYKGFAFKDQQTEKVKKFSDFTKQERLLYMIFQGEKLTLYLEMLQVSWENELKVLKKVMDGIEIPEGKVETEKVKELEEKIKEVDRLMNELVVLRKNTAVKFEDFLGKTFALLQDDIKEEERESYLKAIRNYHDKHKLIERK
tara:strand:- start:11982 stop:12608 length:627 start_codon:yes stop_codon:yes gene_type:complete